MEFSQWKIPLDPNAGEMRDKICFERAHAIFWNACPILIFSETMSGCKEEIF